MRDLAGEVIETGEFEPTGDERVDSALAHLRDLRERSVAEHAAVVEEVHRRLTDTLAETLEEVDDGEDAEPVDQ